MCEQQVTKFQTIKRKRSSLSAGSRLLHVLIGEVKAVSPDDRTTTVLHFYRGICVGL